MKGDSVFIKHRGDLVTYDNPGNPTLRYLELDNLLNLFPYPTLFQEQGILTTRETVIGLTSGASFYDQLGGTHRTLIGDALCDGLSYSPDGHPCGDLSLAGSIYYPRENNEFPEGDYTLLKGILSVGGNEWVGVYGWGTFNQGERSASGETNPAQGCTPPVTPPRSSHLRR